jgi:hypothetical protein
MDIGGVGPQQASPSSGEAAPRPGFGRSTTAGRGNPPLCYVRRDRAFAVQKATHSALESTAPT